MKARRTRGHGAPSRPGESRGCGGIGAGAIPRRPITVPRKVSRAAPFFDGQRSAAKLLTKDEARRIAVNIAKLPALVRGSAAVTGGLRGLGR
jgi:hypothetical protein